MGRFFTKNRLDRCILQSQKGGWRVLLGPKGVVKQVSLAGDVVSPLPSESDEDEKIDLSYTGEDEDLDVWFVSLKLG